jgi:nicotinic acid mononucleotide adenylyltransferase
LDLGKNPKAFYDNKMKNMKFFAKNFYRTYKTSNIRRFIKLDMDVEYLIPKSKQKFVQNGYRTYSKNSGTSKQTDVTPNNKTK